VIDWIRTYITDDGVIITELGKATEDAGMTWRKATDEEMKRFEE
jgi:hypothetical protein